jgi:hypothetical protein
MIFRYSLSLFRYPRDIQPHNLSPIGKLPSPPFLVIQFVMNSSSSGSQEVLKFYWAYIAELFYPPPHFPIPSAKYKQRKVSQI